MRLINKDYCETELIFKLAHSPDIAERERPFIRNKSHVSEKFVNFCIPVF